MNDLEREFEQILKDRGYQYIAQPPKIKLMDFIYADDYQNDDHVQMNQIPDFWVWHPDTHRLDIVEIKGGFIHQDFPFREKILKYMLREKREYIQSQLKTTLATNPQLSIKNDCTEQKWSQMPMTTNYLVLQKNLQKGAKGAVASSQSHFVSLYGSDFLPIGEVKRIAKEREKKQIRDMREFANGMISDLVTVIFERFLRISIPTHDIWKGNFLRDSDIGNKLWHRLQSVINAERYGGSLSNIREQLASLPEQVRKAIANQAKPSQAKPSQAKETKETEETEETKEANEANGTNWTNWTNEANNVKGFKRLELVLRGLKGLNKFYSLNSIENISFTGFKKLKEKVFKDLEKILKRDFSFEKSQKGLDILEKSMSTLEQILFCVLIWQRCWATLYEKADWTRKRKKEFAHAKMAIKQLLDKEKVRTLDFFVPKAQ